jgi:signal transduction histidine kinase
MRRLYVQIYFAVVASLLLLGLLFSALWLWVTPWDGSGLQAVSRLAELHLPPKDASREELESALAALSKDFHLSLALWDANGEQLARAGDAPVPRPGPSWSSSRFVRSRGRGVTVALRLSNGRWLVVRHRQDTHALAVVVSVLLSAAVVAASAYPLVRRLTSRLERLQARVDALGEGQLGSRVAVEGSDEVARLASSFNRAAERIERLVEAQRTLLAGASHELRTPLTRIRMAVELMGDGAPRELKARLEKEISDLDELIGELILASRIETRQVIEREERVDLLALAAEEASRYDASLTELEGSPVEIRGDRALLRRLVRNLLENARRHAPASPIEIAVGPREGGGARIQVLDRGAGVPEGERERIFDPFYSSPSPPVRGDKGVGLGLALVRRIARYHGGDARCLARPGGGSVFEVDLAPLRPGARGERTRKKQEAGSESLPASPPI